jgi:hypothetical protein
VTAVDEYGVVRMRGEELVHAAEEARLAGEARRSARVVDRSVAGAARRVLLAAARVWPGRVAAGRVAAGRVAPGGGQVVGSSR